MGSKKSQYSQWAINICHLFVEYLSKKFHLFSHCLINLKLDSPLYLVKFIISNNGYWWAVIGLYWIYINPDPMSKINLLCLLKFKLSWYLVQNFSPLMISQQVKTILFDHNRNMSCVITHLRCHLPVSNPSTDPNGYRGWGYLQQLFSLPALHHDF